MQGDTGLYASGLADEVDESVRAPTESLKGTSKQGASTSPTPRGIVHRPDLRLGFDNRLVDGFDCSGGRGLLCIYEV